MFEGLFGQFSSEMEIWEIHYNKASVIAEMGVDETIVL